MKRYLAFMSVVPLLALMALLLVEGCGEEAANAQTLPLDVVINEVAWGGTAASSYDEWIELYNGTGNHVDLTDWTLSDGGDIQITLSGGISAHSYFLLERTDDTTVGDLPADQIYTGSLDNSGERIELRNDTQALIDSADGSGGWPSGSGLPDHHSMERIDPGSPDTPANWASNDGMTRNGLDAHGAPLNGTPLARNSATLLPGADLGVNKKGPETALPGQFVTYTISLSNAGQLTAQATWLTDVLPARVQFITHSAPYPFSEPAAGTLVWTLGNVATTTASAPFTFTITTRIEPQAQGELTNLITVTCATTESNPADNCDASVTLVGSQPVTPTILIEALHYDGYELGDADEAVRLMNVSTATAEIGGWSLTDGTSIATFPAGAALLPGQAVWCCKQATAFARQFGFKADFATDSSGSAVPEMEGTWPGFANLGDECLLLDRAGEAVDAVVYRDGNTSLAGWSGSAIEPWTPSTTFAADGQILYRKRDLTSGLPVPDTDTAVDWAQDPDDHIAGRKVLYPGWDLDAFFFTRRVTETASLTLSIAPDNLFETLSPLLASAQESILIESYTFRSKELADVLLERLGEGISVTLLLEGAPAVEGVTDQEKWIVGELHGMGAEILFMINDHDRRVYDRYKNQHAKLIIIDGDIAIIGSENLSPTSMPADDKSNGTAGRRGIFLITDAPGVVSRVQAVFKADADPGSHVDVAGCDQMPDLCTSPPGFQPEMTPDWLTYTVQFPQPFSLTGEMSFEVIQSPENSLRDQDGLLGPLNSAGSGDTILIEQFYEASHWGPSDGSPSTDPNPRLEATLNAARRGATVRMLLDRHFDQEGDNVQTVTYLQGVARAEGLDLQARLGDPTSLGLHNKMVLAQVDDQKYTHVGSINGGEASHKINRELAVQVRSAAAYDYLRAVFEYDWSISTPPVYLPVVVKNHQAPKAADHVLISEVFYAVSKEREWVELVNPTHSAVDLSFYKIGDAQAWGVFEGMYQFPPGTILDPHQVLVIAASATGFRQDNPDQDPDFELYTTDNSVPTLQPYSLWSTGEWHLSNDGDEILLLDSANEAVDVMVYGDGLYPGVVPHPGVSLYTHSLERFPYLNDTDDCSMDFRDWPFPNPGDLP